MCAKFVSLCGVGDDDWTNGVPNLPSRFPIFINKQDSRITQVKIHPRSAAKGALIVQFGSIAAGVKGRVRDPKTKTG